MSTTVSNTKYFYPPRPASGRLTFSDNIVGLQTVDGGGLTQGNFDFTTNVVEKVKNNGLIDIILMDTIHTAEQFELEWNLYTPLLNDGAIILVDDIYYDSKYMFFDKIQCKEKFIDKRLHSTGLGVIIYDKQ